ncbi:MAG: hypothetical protein HYV19_05305 [Gemmatimonadetes bacterium]|nr:hypothetical protein [Gemmatimonadota bacterium]
MFVELIDRLRCLNIHTDTWLVAAASRSANRHLIDATLGCPECDAEYEVRDGEVWFGEVVPRATTEPMNVDDAMRAAALLKCQEHGLYVLDGAWGGLAAALQQIVDVDLLLTDPPSVPSTHAAAGQGTLRGVGERWPLASASLHGMALDHATDARTADALRVLRPGGRLVAPVGSPLPAGARELARDDRHWVAEKAADVITLRRAT